MTTVVSDLVVQTQAAASEAIARHYYNLLSTRPRNLWGRVAHALDYKYVADLDERTSSDQVIGFDHIGTSLVFRRRLRPILHQSQASHHIWERDDDQGLVSLFPRKEEVGSISIERAPRRTRASALVQKMIRDCRDFRQADKATRRRDDLAQQVTVPSPLAIAGELLTDPANPGSQAYAWAALQEWVRERIEAEMDQPIDLSFAAVSEALILINNRWRTSKPIASKNEATVLFICHVLALRGVAAMRVDVGYLVDVISGQFERGTQDDDTPAFLASDMTWQMDGRLQELWLGTSGRPSGFIVNPRVTELPSAGELLNLVDSLPVPFEGGDTVFQGGIRLASNRSLVATISGEFGTGKTLFGLSLAAALAPLGCRTLFLSCEESADDITDRLVEAAPRSLFRTLPLFRALNEADFRLKTLSGRQAGARELGWFSAAHLKLDRGSAGFNTSAALETFLKEARETADIFSPWANGDPADRPRFARPVIIIDGLHQLFDEQDSWDFLDNALRSLIETCRDLGAIFLFSFSAEREELRRLEYLCDLIIEVERGGHNLPADKPYRIFQLLKARRQPARTGAHLFHIKGDAGFRLKPSVDARVQQLKTQSWWAPSEGDAIFLTNDPPPGFRSPDSDARLSNSLSVANHGQVLIIGHGSSGKAGFGLYLLHRRWFDLDLTLSDRQRRLPIGNAPADLPPRKRAIVEAGLPVRSDVAYLETRVLVISFLYQQSYYDDLTRKLRARRRRRPDREDSWYASIEEREPMEFAPLPDRLWTDTIELYPGMLSVEDFLAKVEKRLGAAEMSGFPYTGVLVDGLHNVFVQFPALEKESSFWGMFYNILRRRRVTVVTTHTEFDINARNETASGARGLPIAYNFDQAERKIAPLLSALISGADYLFELSPSYEVGSPVYRLTPRAMLGDNVGGQAYSWDKRRMQLEPLAHLGAKGARSTGDERIEMVQRLAERMTSFLAP
ncbi:hypothetical protein [uncultured Brevundimonas sp.]|uniref:hypothetical protein n=1 Tax=uncultured Brevundimonas sp. TaxID=213418 RepID=UPI0025CCB510|nr:hypothetical protein [uncultured Brevundimonas sp.]